MYLLIGFTLAGIIAFIATKVGSLTRSGGLAAFITGGLIFSCGGFPWAVLLMIFFISSSLLSRLFANRKEGLNIVFSKDSRRDCWQVFANGGLGSVLALFYSISDTPTWIWLCFAGAMAAVNADTWATEIGVLSGIKPRLITTRRIVERGTSGGVTQLGNLASAGGAVLIGIVSGLFSESNVMVLTIIATTIGGVAGAMFDSFLGATVQAIYHCRTCQKNTERHPIHTCGSRTELARGWRWLNNDVVNFLASVVGGTVATVVWASIR